MSDDKAVAKFIGAQPAAPVARRKDLSGKTVLLVSADHMQYTVPIEIAGYMSPVLTNMINEQLSDSESSITLPNVSSKCLSKIIEFLVYHFENPLPPWPAKKKRMQQRDQFKYDYRTSIEVHVESGSGGSGKKNKKPLQFHHPQPGIHPGQLSVVANAPAGSIGTVVLAHQQQQGQAQQSQREEKLSEWDRAYCDQLDRETLFELIMASNFLDIRWLLDVCCKAVCVSPEKSSPLALKDPEDVRRYLNIKNDFTPQEEEFIRRDMSWALDKDV